MDHRKTVESIYTAFKQQDVATMLGHLSEDVVWEYAYAPGIAPWLEPRRGKAGALEFLKTLGTELHIEAFVVNAVFADEQRAVALVDLDGTVARTGRRISERDEVHIWHFDAAGKVIRFRHAADTLQQHRAYTGRDS
jgi:ketosteroid isomerase-like protein